MGASQFADELQGSGEIDVAAAADALVEAIGRIGSCVVAFSGGVDSSVVAAAAFKAMGDRALAVTAAGAAVSDFDRQYAQSVAAEIGLRHLWVETEEIDDPDYARNDARRCYHCKRTLYATLRQIADREGIATILSGTNADDLGDYRPGLQAAEEFGIRAPLAELRIDKVGIRRIAAHWGMAVADRPAAPCLSSRLAYGVPVTRERLRMVELAERSLRALGFPECRVRVHEGELARIEVPAFELPRFVGQVDFAAFAAELRSVGFRFVTLDLQGFRSGSLNPPGVRSLPVLGDSPHPEPKRS